MANNTYPEDRSYRAWHQQQMQNPEYAREFEAQRPEFDAIIKLIELRRERGMSQKQLAEQAGTTQPSVARLESRKKTRNLSLLERMAGVLDHKVTVGVEPSRTPLLNQVMGSMKVAPKKAAAKMAAAKKVSPRKWAVGAKKEAPKKAAPRKVTPARRPTIATGKRIRAAGHGRTTRSNGRRK